MAKEKTEKKPKAEKVKVDLFLALSKLTQGDIQFFDKLTDEEKKSLAPVVVMRWLSCVSDSKQIIYINHLLNPLVFTLYNHPDLLFKLMMASSTPSQKRFNWIKKNGASTKIPLSLNVLERYYNCSSIEAKQYYEVHNKDDIVEMAESLAEDQSFIEKLKKE